MILAERVLRRERSGSSSPVVVRTSRGERFVKLRGAAQGITALIAELIVAELAETVRLAVPARELVDVAPAIESDDLNDELRDLLDASVGVNVGFAMLDGARDLKVTEYESVPLDAAAPILWLDTLVQNLDRSRANPNIMVRRGEYWLIDHGAALPFQHNWSSVREDSAQRPYDTGRHVFAWAAPVLATVHETLAPLMTRDRIRDAAHSVPDEFLAQVSDDVTRRRAMYATFLWKRLQWMHATLG